ncbi:hypothetical protein U1Q18_025932 [Sarracenia purpurea var. burkii]
MQERLNWEILWRCVFLVVMCDSNGENASAQNAKYVSQLHGERSQWHTLSTCPSNVHWTNDGLERDLYIQTTTVTVLAMDGRRRWLDIEKLMLNYFKELLDLIPLLFTAQALGHSVKQGCALNMVAVKRSNGKSHFILVTNLAPCSGIRLHLWPEKGKSASDMPVNERVLEVTQKMVHIPSGPAPRQIEPGSQTEQAPPSAVFLLAPGDMHGFRFLTLSVAPSPTVSGRPPPAASMAVGQFFSPEEGELQFSPQLLLFSTFSPKYMISQEDRPLAFNKSISLLMDYSFTHLLTAPSLNSVAQDITLKEDHPLAFNMSFTISLGLLPVKLALKTTGCGIKKSALPAEEAGDVENNSKAISINSFSMIFPGNAELCKLRCFPPVALAWDTTSGLHIFPNLYSETIVVDSSPALWSLTQGSEKTSVLLLVDPHCSYKVSVAVSLIAAAKRFLLLYYSEIAGFSIAVVFFALMRQAHAWELDSPLPSMLSAIESNLRIPLPFFSLAIVPLFIASFISFLTSQPFPPFVSFILVSIVCYLFANGTVILLVLITQLVFYAAAVVHVFIKTRWQLWEGNLCFVFLHWFLDLSSSFLSFKVVKVLRVNLLLVTALVAVTLVCFVHPALGLFILILCHALSCHNALSSFLTASFRSHALRSHAQSKESFDSRNEGNDRSEQFAAGPGDGFNQHFLLDDSCLSSPDSSRSFGDTQLEMFHHRHGLLILHLLAALMFVPSLVAWLQRIGTSGSFPWFADSALCISIILHGICDSKPEFNFFSHPLLGIPGWEVKLSAAYLLAGYYSYLSGLALEPYWAFYPMAAIGVISLTFRIIQRRNKEKGDAYFSTRKHSHRH